MPMHDWKAGSANRYHHFHQFWTVELCTQLNAEVLPDGYIAMVDQRTPQVAPDVLALERRRSRKPRRPFGGLAVADAPPQVRVVSQQADAVTYAEAANRVAVRNLDGELVAVIELMSPGNKHSKYAIKQFVAKACDYINQGVHVLVVDPFPPTKRDPLGIHKVIWDEFQDEPFDLPADKPLTAASYSAGEPRTAYVENFAVGDRLPSMPLFLDNLRYVPTPLEGSYQAAWDRNPPDFHELVENAARASKRRSPRSGR